MNWDRIEEKWESFKDEIRKNWDCLSDDDLQEIDGDRQKLETKLQQHYDKSPREARREVDELAQELTRDA